MRIDPAICQKILIAVESDDKAGTGHGVTVELEGIEPNVVAHHVKYLVDREMLKAIETTDHQSTYPEFIVTDITPEGRAYLDEREPEQGVKKKFGF